jgi:hypothetical protein
MTRHRNPKSGFAAVLELCVAAGLMVDEESRSFKRADDLTRLESGQSPIHIRP